MDIPIIQKWIGGYNVDLQYNSTEGFRADLSESIRGLNNEFVEPMKPILEAWNKFFDNNRNGYYIQFAHSQGAINVRNCLQIYPEERRSRIIVLAISPAAYIDPKLCADVRHFISENDFYANKLFTQHLSNKDFKDRNNSYITRLKGHKSAPRFADHSLKSKTFENPVYKYSKISMENYGGLK